MWLRVAALRHMSGRGQSHIVVRLLNCHGRRALSEILQSQQWQHGCCYIVIRQPCCDCNLGLDRTSVFLSHCCWTCPSLGVLGMFRHCQTAWRGVLSSTEEEPWNGGKPRGRKGPGRQWTASQRREARVKKQNYFLSVTGSQTNSTGTFFSSCWVHLICKQKANFSEGSNVSVLRAFVIVCSDLPPPSSASHSQEMHRKKHLTSQQKFPVLSSTIEFPSSLEDLSQVAAEEAVGFCGVSVEADTSAA